MKCKLIYYIINAHTQSLSLILVHILSFLLVFLSSLFGYLLHLMLMDHQEHGGKSVINSQCIMWLLYISLLSVGSEQSMMTVPLLLQVEYYSLLCKCLKLKNVNNILLLYYHYIL